jgi:septum formation protein
MKIILASASPRRKELLAQIGLAFEIVVSDVEEIITKDKPAEIVEELSFQKAQAVLQNLTTDEEVLVIGADTIVADGSRILGKPVDEKDAVDMLSALQGKAHEVYTGVTLLHRKAGEVEQRVFHEATKVHFYSMSEAEITEYVATKDPMDKAGAYGIQGFCARYISGIEGDYNNVVGLPVGRLYQEAKEWL